MPIIASPIAKLQSTSCSLMSVTDIINNIEHIMIAKKVFNEIPKLIKL